MTTQSCEILSKKSSSLFMQQSYPFFQAFVSHNLFIKIKYILFMQHLNGCIVDYNIQMSLD